MNRVYHQILVSRDLGGAGLMALRIAAELRHRSRCSRVWVPGEGAASQAARGAGLDVRCFNPASLAGTQGRLRSTVGNLVFARDLVPLGRGIVHVHSPSAYRLLLPAVMLTGLRRVAHVQIEEQPETLAWAFRQPPHLIITCARYLVESVRRALPPAFRETQWIEAVPNAVDVRRFAPGDKPEAKRRVGAPDGIPLVLMLANLAPHKGQETAIQAVAMLKDAGVALQCWLAGTERGGATTYTARLRALIDDLGVGDRVRLLGQRDDAEHLLRAAEFFVLPSTHEGLPLSILEAQAAMVPVLAAPTAGVPEVVADGETGFLIAADDAAGYAGRMRSLLENPALARRVAEQAYVQALGEFNWDSHCERIIGLYEELLERSGRYARRRTARTHRPSAALN